jgi:hypothetical protein
MANKNIKHSTAPKKPAKNVQNQPIVFEEYVDMLTMRKKPVSDAYLEKFAIDMLNWAKTSNALVFGNYFHDCGVSYATFRRWKERSPKLAEVYEHVCEIIGARREEGGLKRKYDSSMVMKSMPIYSYDWKKLEIERDERRKPKENVGTGNITVVLEDYSKKEKNEKI